MTQQAGQGAGSPATVDIPEELQREIRTFAAEVSGMDFYQILGVERDCSTDAIRGAFFERSRRFHPDRYFNKRLGPYAGLLHELYKRVVAANEVLRDAELRGHYDRSLGPPPPPVSAPAPGPAPSAAPTPAARVEPAKPAAAATPAPPTKPSALRSKAATPPLAAKPESPVKPVKPGPPSSRKSSLRERSGLRAPLAGIQALSKRLEVSRNKARDLFEQAQQFAARSDWAEAVRCGRLALAFDPRERAYQDCLAQWFPHIQADMAQRARDRAESALLKGDRAEALDAFTEALDRAPNDAALALRAAGVALELRDFTRAVLFAESAVALEELHVGSRKLLGLIYRTAGRRDDARRAFQRAWELDPTDREIKAWLAQ